MPTAACVRDGLVEESVGLYCLSGLISPVLDSAVVMPRSCSRIVAIVRSFTAYLILSRCERLRFWGEVGDRRTPGAEAPFLWRGESAKAEALAYLEAVRASRE